MQNLEFKNPLLLWLLILLPFLIWQHYANHKKGKQTLAIPSLIAFKNEFDWTLAILPFLFYFRIFAFGLIIIGLARPRTAVTNSIIKTDKGIDIMLTVDVSLSMLSRDLEPDRLTALKKVAQKFVLDRPSDRIGLVAYSGEALTKVPLTTDKAILTTAIENLKPQELQDGTAIGVGLATTINHIKDSKAKSKIIILMTDGVESINYMNKLLYVTPRKAAEIAAENGIKTYTIGIGTNGYAPFPSGYSIAGDIYFTDQEVKIDEELLQEIAQKTGGKYFRATDNKSLEIIYGEINKLEKTEINELKYYNYTELFRYFMLPALLFLLLDLMLSMTIYKQFI